MPKGRYSTANNGMSAGHSGGGHADGPGGVAGGYAPGGMGVEPQAISEEPRSVVIEQYSRTRHQMEPLLVTFNGPGNGAHVVSGSGHGYETTIDSCTCPDFVMRHHACRHIQAIRNSMGLPPLGDDWRPGANTETQVPPDDLAQQQHQRDEEMRDRLARLAEMDTEQGFVSEDENLWNQCAEMAQEPPIYETENVLDGPEGNTFGIELEFAGGNRIGLGRALYEAGLIRSPQQDGYHSGVYNNDMVHWRYERDGSVDGEIVSPPLRDTPESWEQIKKVCEIAKQYGARVDARCGGHVHVGKEPLDQNRNRKHRLFQLVAGNEDIFFRMAAAGEMNGRFRGFHYVNPIGDQWYDRRAATDQEAERRIGIRDRTSNYPAVNMRENTVEFRYFNGSLTPEQIQANVKLAYNTVKAAAIENRRTQRGQLLPERSMPVGTSRESEDMGTVKRFFDTVFSKSKDKVSAMRAFMSSRWQERS
ncbi:putative amidoligase enzyme [Peptococcaceae bacterium CEB3]|nr:putative amidoligase enzyme [Peptococcaceae bacterium CEB3]